MPISTNDELYEKEHTKHPQSKMFKQINKNINYIRKTIGDPPDLIIREMKLGITKQNATLLAINGMVNKDIISSNILRPLSQLNHEINDITYIKDHVLQTMTVNKENELRTLVNSLLTGNVVLFLENQVEALAINTIQISSRNIEEPQTEPTVRGSHEGFIENLIDNMSLIRKRLINPQLRFEEITIGSETNTTISMCYLADIADPNIVKEVRKRLHSIKTATILDSGYIEQYIEDEPQSVFPTIANTEKPDRLVGNLLEGRVGILVDGTPMTLIVPHVLVNNFQSAEDYYSRPFYVSFVRMIRFISFFFAVNLPAFYIATQNFHKEMIPTELLSSIAAARQGVPFPVVMEITIMLIIFEILREAGVRMPRAIGQAVSIVGALILGEAAVTAGIVGAPTIIVVGLTGISTFIVTPVADAVSILRYFMIIPAGVIGLYGLLLANLALLVHLSSLKSFGVPYLSPVSPIYFKDWRDVFVRIPLRKMKEAPNTISQQRKIRHKKPDKLIGGKK